MANFIAEDFKRIMRGKNYTQKLILVNSVVFVVLNILLAATSNTTGELIVRNIGLPAGMVSSILKIWTYFTYMFVHQGFFHILFNMLWLYWMGRIVSDLYGSQRVLIMYIFGGLAGGILFTLTATLGLIPSHSFLIGASGGVLAVMTGTAALLPDYQIKLLLIGPVKLKYLALVGFILSTVLDFTQNLGGKIAHVGGAAFGLIYGLQLKKGTEITDKPVAVLRTIISAFKPEKKMKVVHKNKSKNNASTKVFTGNYANLSETERQQKVDVILDKISQSGYDSLSKAEKDFLFTMSNR